MTKYGALINGSMTTAQKIGILNDLGVEYVRNAITLSDYDGSQHGPYDKYNTAGKKILLNLNWDTPAGGPVPFPTDMTAYATQINAVLDDLPADPEVIVIENEELNSSYHDTPLSNIDKYVTMLETATAIAHSRGLKICNGGIAGVGLDILVWRYLNSTYDLATADHYADGTMTTGQRNAAATPGSNPGLDAAADVTQAVLDGVISANCDYVNIHAYEVFDQSVVDPSVVTTISPDVIRYQQEYLIAYTGKPVITNETGQRGNEQPALVEAMLLNYWVLGFDYVIWFSGDSEDGADAHALNDQTTPFALRPNGEAFRDLIADLEALALDLDTTDAAITLPTDSTSVTATLTDPGGLIVSTQWRKISGPSTYTIGSPASLTTLFDNLVEGTYEFVIDGFDEDSNRLITSETFTVVVSPDESGGGGDDLGGGGDEESATNTGRYIAYRSGNVELAQTGYLKAWLSLLSDFETLNEPVLSDPPVIGEKYTIGVSHEWIAGKEAIPVYIRKDLLESPGETVGEIGTLMFLWTPKVFVIGDGAAILEMMNNWANEDLVLFVQDECNPSKYLQFGSECYPCNVQKNSFSSGTLKSGQKGFFITLESLSKYFYNGTITERA